MPRPFGYHHTAESKEKIKLAMLGRTFSQATLDKMRVAAAIRGKQMIGDKNPSWKGGVIMSRGRALQYVGPGRHVPRSRLVAEAALGRPLLADEDAHHKNEVKDDDRPNNLHVLPKAEHARLHANSRRRDKRTGRWLS